MSGIDAFTSGDLARAYDVFLASAAASDTSGAVAVAEAARVAILANDVERARAALARYRDTNFHGRAVDADARTLEAGILGLEGRRDASVAAYRDAWREWRGLGCRFDLAIAQLTAASVLGVGDPEVASVIVECRETLTQLRARPLLQRLDALVDRAAPSGREAASSHTSEPTVMEPAT
jgi:hypothetical protein